MILENIHRLSKTQIPIVIRIPIIPGINDSEDDMRAFEDYVYWVFKSRLYSWFRNIYVVIHHQFEQGREMTMTIFGAARRQSARRWNISKKRSVKAGGGESHATWEIR